MIFAKLRRNAHELAHRRNGSYTESIVLKDTDGQLMLSHQDLRAELTLYTLGCEQIATAIGP